MGITKAEHFTEKQNNIANIMKALGHPARIAIIEYLLKVNKCMCGNIVEVLPLSQATVSQHLKELKNAGLIKGTVEGNTICYCIDEKAIIAIQKYFALIEKKIEKQKADCCN